MWQTAGLEIKGSWFSWEIALIVEGQRVWWEETERVGSRVEVVKVVRCALGKKQSVRRGGQE